MQAQHPLQRAFRAVPLLAGASVAVVSCLVALTMQQRHSLPPWLAPLVAACTSLLCAGAVQAFAIPHIRRQLSQSTKPVRPGKGAGLESGRHQAADRRGPDADADASPR